jgi:hypothetical protein
MRCRSFVVVAAVIALALAPAPAAGDSIVYEKDGNIWQAAPDGSRQTQVTTAGGYARPTQAGDGTIIAVKDKLLHRLDRSGRLLNTAGDPENCCITLLTPHVSPDGQRLVYNLFDNGPLLTGPRIATSYSARPTPRDEIDQSLSGYLNPTWIDNGRAVIFPGGSPDTQIWTIPGGVEDWFYDEAVDLGGGEVNAQNTRFASTADGASKIRLYTMSGPPPALPTPACDFTAPNGTFFRPTWSPDGGWLAWQEDDGIWTAGFCDQATLVIPGGRAPDWGPANVSTPGANPNPNPNPTADTKPTTVKAGVARRVTRRALLRGLTVRVTCNEPCRATAELRLDRRSAKRLRLGGVRSGLIGRATRQLAQAGTVKLRLRPSAKARKRLRRGRVRSVSVRVGATDAAGNRSKTIARKVAVHG